MGRTALITGISSLDNRGVEALLRSASVAIHRRRPDLGVAVLSRPSAGLDHACVRGMGVTPIPVAARAEGDRRPVTGRLAGRRLRLLRGHGPSGWTSDRPGSVSDAVRSACVVICSGGDLFGPHYGTIASNLRPLRAAQSAGVPTYFLAQSVGPFASREDERQWASVAAGASLITLREPDSYAYVTGEMGISTRLCHETADPAFLLEPAPPATVAAIREGLGLTDRRPLIAIAPSHSITRYAGLDKARHVDAWIGLVRTLLRATDAQVLLVSHVIRDAGTDDRTLAAEIIGRAGTDERVHLAGSLSAAEIKGLIGGCDLLVAERMHAAIAGLSSGVPTVLVSYSRKAGGIMRQVLGGARMQSLTIPVDRFLDPGVATDRVCAALTERVAIRDELGRAIPRIVALAERNFELLDELVPAHVQLRSVDSMGGASS